MKRHPASPLGVLAGGRNRRHRRARPAMTATAFPTQLDRPDTDHRPDYPTALARLALLMDGHHDPSGPALAARADWFRNRLAESTDPATRTTTKEN